MGKRAKSEGTIFYSEARQKWVAQMPAGADGRRPLRTAATEGEALALLRSMHADRAQGRDLSKKADTVKELLEAARDSSGVAASSTTEVDLTKDDPEVLGDEDTAASASTHPSAER